MICKVLNHAEHLLTLASKVTVCVSIFAFAFLVGIPVGIASSAAAIKICVITSEVKKHKSVIRKKKT